MLDGGRRSGKCDSLSYFLAATYFGDRSAEVILSPFDGSVSIASALGLDQGCSDRPEPVLRSIRRRATAGSPRLQQHPARMPVSCPLHRRATITLRNLRENWMTFPDFTRKRSA